MNKGFTSGCGSQIRTDDLRVMSPTSYRAAPSRDISTQEVFSWVLIYYIMLNAICQVFFQKKLKIFYWVESTLTESSPDCSQTSALEPLLSPPEIIIPESMFSISAVIVLRSGRAPMPRSLPEELSRHRWWSSALCRKAERAPWASAEVCGRWIPSAPRPACGTLPHCLFGW